jgi:hypothetical protein
MTTRLPNLKWLTVLGVASLWLLFPTEARADAIDIGFVAVAGAVVLVPLMAFEVFVEAIFLAVGLKVTYRKVLLLSLGANLASLAAGIPAKVFNAWMYPHVLPHELAPYFRHYPEAALLGTAIYFVVTVLVELLVVFGWCLNRRADISLRRAAVVVVLANGATYAVLAPLHYLATRPIHDIQEFTDDTHWAQRPVTRIYYVDSDNGNLCSITTDGHGRQVLVPDTVKDYQFRPDGGWFLYRNGSNNLCLWRKSKGKPQVCWKTDQRFTMERVACSPDGTIVAYLSQLGDPTPYELVLRDTDSGRVVRTGVKTQQDTIAWSNAPAVLFLGGTKEAFQVHKDLSATPVRPGTVRKDLPAVYGRFTDMMKSSWWGGDDWGASFDHDESGRTEATAFHGLESHLRVKTNDGSTFVLADNPGLLHLPSRFFDGVFFLANGNEIVFDDSQDIYLLDVAHRKVGWIAHGTKAVTLSARYQRKMTDGKK